jgi:hypothetical protein
VTKLILVNPNSSQFSQLLQNNHIMKSRLLSFVLFFSVAVIHAQEEKPQIYDPSVDAKLEIQKAVAQAKLESKHVLLQIGGNW